MDDEELRMLRIEKVIDLFPISKVSLYRMIKKGEFPAPVKLGGCSVWSNVELKAWLRNRLTPRRREIDDLV